MSNHDWLHEVTVEFRAIWVAKDQNGDVVIGEGESGRPPCFIIPRVQVEDVIQAIQDAYYDSPYK